MFLRNFFMMILWMFYASCLFSQGWEKEFSEEMWPYHMLETNDGGFLISGYFTVDEPGTFVTKIDSIGDQGWRLNFIEGGGILLDGRMIRTVDGNIVLRVRTKVDVNGSDYVKHKFIKINEAGDILWERILNEAEEEINYVGNFFAEPDSSITFSARIGADHFIGSLDSSGVVTSLNPSPGFFFVPRFSQTPDGRYYYQEEASGNTAVLRETNLNGDLVIERVFPGRSTGELFLQSNNDLIVFESYPTFEGVRQLRIDSMNNLIDIDTLWSGSNVESGVTTYLADGFLQTGTIKPTNNSPNSILVTKTDFDGNIIWQQNYDHRFGDQEGNRTYATADGGHLTLGIYFPEAGSVPSLGQPQDAYMIKSDDNGIIYSNVISGLVKVDANQNCMVDSAEIPIQDWIITATKGQEVFVTTTNGNGEYVLPVDEGEYELRLNLPNSYWAPCANDVLINVVGNNNTEQLDFEVQEMVNCPNMTIAGSVPTVRPCVVRPSYINYCNYGTMVATGAYVDINYDEFIAPVSSTIPWVALPDNIYRFELGDVDPLTCGDFRVDLMLDCDATVGASYCIEAQVYPDSLCEPPSPNWSGAFLEVNGVCEGDELRFRIENTGDGDMIGYTNYIIVEDVILLMEDSVELVTGDFIEDVLGANGSTYTLIADQVADAPGNSFPMAVIEGCGENGDGTFSVGFANQFQFNDANLYQDIDCPIAVNSFDPNDKQGFPTGYKAPHFIEPSTTIEYLIRFQNTGTDTAYHVVIRDTLDEHFDITSFQAGASSHEYDLDMEGQGVVKFTFSNINLPDSIVDLSGSNGFVEFKITPKDSIAIGSVIHNKAGIYFDLNEPVITNETFHTIGQDFIEVISDVIEHPFLKNIEILVYPNPFVDQARLEIVNHGLNNTKYLLEIFNANGSLVRSEKHQTAIIDLKRDQLSSGLYFYKLTAEDGLLNTGRILIQ